MAITIDTRVHVAGDMMVVTGTYAAGDASIDLSAHLSSVFFAGCNGSTDLAGYISAPDAATDTHTLTAQAQLEIDGTTLRFKTLSGQDVAGSVGTFFAIGQR
jgi:hypothetical protein